MVERTGLTSAVMHALSGGEWMTTAKVVAGVGDGYKARAGMILIQKTKTGFLERRGVPRQFEYRIKPVPLDVRTGTPKPCALAAANVTAEQATPYKSAVVAVDSLVPSMGRSCNTPPLNRAQGRIEASIAALLACAPAATNVTAEQATPYKSAVVAVGSLVPSMGRSCNAPPLNRAQGRIEDAIAAVLDRHTGRRLDEILAAVPNGWSRTEVISGLSEGVINGWITARTRDERNSFLLLKDPPAHRVDPLAERFKVEKLVERCALLDTDLADALLDAREYDAPAGFVRALVDLRHSAARLMSYLED